MSEIAESLNRPASLPTKFFGCELGAQSRYEEDVSWRRRRKGRRGRRPERAVVADAECEPLMQSLVQSLSWRTPLPLAPHLASLPSPQVEKATVNGAHTAQDMQRLLNLFIDKFVLCPKCHLPETALAVSIKTGFIKHKCVSGGGGGGCSV